MVEVKNHYKIQQYQDSDDIQYVIGNNIFFRYLFDSYLYVH